MLTVSSDYSDAIIPSTSSIRQTQVRITVKALADGTSSTVTDSGGADAHSRDEQVVNGVYNTRYRFASAEPNCWKLDGSTVLQPDPAQTSAEVGFVSEDVSGVGGVYDTPPYIEVTLDIAADVQTITIFFDLLDNEYAVDFDVDWTTSGDSGTIVVEDNTTAVYHLFEAFSGLTSVTVTVNKWSVVSKKAKITEIAFGLIEQFAPEMDEPLLMVNGISEVDITSETMPNGELSFEFYDTNNDFSVINPSDRTMVFTEGTMIEAEIGVSTADGSFEYVLAGTYHYGSWGHSRNKVVRVQSVDLIGFSGARIPLEQYGLRTKTSAYNAVLSFINDEYAANLDSTTNVDISTDQFPNTGTDFLEGPYAETVSEELIRLAQWSMTVPRIDNEGVLHFVPISFSVVKTIDIDNVFEDPEMIRGNQIKGVRAYYSDVAVSSDVTEIASSTGSFGAGTTLIFDIGYDYEFYDIVASGGAVLESSIGFSYGKYTLEASGTGTITIRGKAWVIGKQYVEAPNPDVTDPKALWIEIDNPHVCTADRATDIANYYLGIYAKIAELNVGWRGTPEIEMLDTVNLEAQDGIEADTVVVKHDWTHDGALKYTTKGAAMWLH